MRDFFLGLAVVLVVAISSRVLAWYRARADRRAVLSWLRAMTRDDPSFSNQSTTEIAEGTGLGTERVEQACESQQEIFRFSE